MRGWSNDKLRKVLLFTECFEDIGTANEIINVVRKNAVSVCIVVLQRLYYNR